MFQGEAGKAFKNKVKKNWEKGDFEVWRNKTNGHRITIWMDSRPVFFYDNCKFIDPSICGIIARKKLKKSTQLQKTKNMAQMNPNSYTT